MSLPSPFVEEVTTARHLGRSRLTTEQRTLAALELIADELEAMRCILWNNLRAPRQP